MAISKAIASSARRALATVRLAAHRSADLFFPPECIHCRSSLTGARAPLCVGCWVELFPQLGTVCQRCGAPVPEHLSRDNCHLCAGDQLHFEWARGLGVYNGGLAQYVQRMKHFMHQPLALAAGRLLAAEFAVNLRAAGVELIVPIPMHWLRRLASGVNNPDLAAETLGQALRLPVAYDLLRARRRVPRQTSLTPRERRRNLRGAFGVSRTYHIKGARIALVDDVLTTGATASEAAWTLKQAGAEAVVVVVVARGIGD